MSQDHPATHVLIVDDDPRMRRMIERFLLQEGFRVSCAGNGRGMRQVLQADPPALVLLDLILPGEDGLTLAAELRQEDVGVIIVSGKGETVDRIVGLEVGADDYLTKPFDQRELLARIHSVLRRVGQGQRPREAGELLHFRGWRLDTAGRALLAADGSEVHLTGLEFDLLALLVSHPQRVFSRDELTEGLQGREWNPADRSIDVLVAKLRRKLRQHDPDTEYICGIRNVGYKFLLPVRRS